VSTHHTEQVERESDLFTSKSSPLKYFTVYQEEEEQDERRNVNTRQRKITPLTS
jgi:hypothetical protein